MNFGAIARDFERKILRPRKFFENFGRKWDRFRIKVIGRAPVLGIALQKVTGHFTTFGHMAPPACVKCLVLSRIEVRGCTFRAEARAARVHCDSNAARFLIINIRTAAKGSI